MLAVEKLYGRYKQDVFRYLVSLTHDAALAEDLLSDCFIIAIRRLPFFRGESSVKTWLFAIARHCWLQHMRKTHPESRFEEALAAAVPEDIAAGILKKEAAERARSLISGMDERTQTVVNMRLQGYAYRQIAERLRVSEGSVRVIYYRAKRELKEQLLREGYDDATY